MPEPIVVLMKVDRVTKGAVRYREVESDIEVFPVIYIRKEALKHLGSTQPDEIQVTLELK